MTKEQFDRLKNCSTVIKHLCDDIDSDEPPIIDISSFDLNVVLRFLQMKKVENFLTDFTISEQYTILMLVDFLDIKATFGKRKTRQIAFESLKIPWSTRMAILEHCVLSKEDLKIPATLMPDEEWKSEYHRVKANLLEIHRNNNSRSIDFATCSDFTHICLSDDESIMACLTSHGHVYVRTKATCRKLPGTANSLGLSSDGKKIIVARNKEGTITIRRYKTNALEEPKAEFRIKVHDIVHKNLVRFDKGLLHKYSTLQPKILMHPNKKHFCILSSFFFLHNFQGKLECLTDLSVTNENGHIFADGSLHIWGHVIPKINYFVKKFDHQLQQHTQEIIREPLYPDLIPCYLKMHHDDPQAFYTSWNDRSEEHTSELQSRL